jgi:uncharacterized membrane protein (UPF0127 family)
MVCLPPAPGLTTPARTGISSSTAVASAARPCYVETVRTILLIVALIIPHAAALAAGGETLPSTTISFGPNLKIEAELAYEDATRTHGLMFRTSLPEDAGMLFIFPYLDYQSFWMKNTLIPLDMIWLNERREIVYFVTAVPCKADPCPSYVPMQKAKYVLEVNAGFAKEHGLKIGQRLDFTIDPAIERIVNPR